MSSNKGTVATSQVRVRRGLFESLLGALPLNTTLFRFMLVGASGYVIYQVVVLVMYETGLFAFLPDKGEDVPVLFFTHGDGRLLFSTLVATELAIIGVFTGNNLWTFRLREVAARPLLVRFGQFNAKALVSTLGILTGLVNVLTVNFGIYHSIAIPIGVMAAFVWNWLWDTQFIWRRGAGAAK